LSGLFFFSLVVLGNPGSGCSTFLKTLVNQRHEYHAIEGEVCYDSFTADELAKHYRGDLQYCPEDDDHFATLTVDQTISFAASMRIPENRPDKISRSEYIREMTNTLESTFGLQHVRNTVVGDAAIRGVSGGEKKRVSLSEMMSSRALIGAWDKLVPFP
jgi:ATP-binding cassette, subfamily G (WHITE), member 2, PDR